MINSDLSNVISCQCVQKVFQPLVLPPQRRTLVNRLLLWLLELGLGQGPKGAEGIEVGASSDLLAPLIPQQGTL